MRFLRSLFLSAVIFTSSVGLGFTKEDKAPLTLAVYQWRPKEEQLAKWQPLATYLSGVLNGREVRVSVMDEAELDTALDDRRVDFLLTNPRHYISLRTTRALTGALATLIELDRNRPIANLGGVIVVRADEQQIKELTDLKGKRISFPGTQFMGAYLAPAHALAKVGVLVPRDAQLISSNGRQDLGLQALNDGTVEAAFIRSGYLEELATTGKVDIAKFRVLGERNHSAFSLKASTDLYPNWPFVALKHVPSDVAAKVSGALFQIKNNDAVALACGIYGFSVPGDYAPVEDALRQLRLPPFGNAPTITKEDVWNEFKALILAASGLGAVIIFLSIFLGVRTRQLSLARNEIQHKTETLEVEVSERTSALGDALRRFNGFMNIVPSAISIVDFNGQVKYLNPGFEQFLGYTVDDIRDMENWWLTAYPDTDYRQKIRRDWESELSICANGGAPIKDFEAKIRTKSGSFVWVSAYAHVAEETIYIAMVDTTARKLQQEKIISLNDSLERRVVEAEAANSAKSAFLANMSHEIRTPMNGILGMVHLLRRTGPSSEQSKKLNVIESSGKHLLAIISDILDLSKIDAGKSKLDKKDFVLAEVLESALSIIRIGAHEKGVRLKLITENLPHSVHGDPVRLTQALVNYLGNALKFTDTGSITLAASVAEEQPLSYFIRFSVSDTGIGIPEPQQQKVFQAFEQADNSSTRVHGGTGLGLAITQRIANMMGGKVGLDSAEGKGSTFWLTAYFGKAQEPEEQRQEEILGDCVELIQSKHSGKRILIVEDEPINQEIARGLLEDIGLCIDTADNGAEAVQMAREIRYDLILMDMQMPVMHGLDATKRIRQISTCVTVPIVAMTANAFIEDRESCLAAGMNDFMTKPTDPSRLFQTVYQWLETPPVSTLG